MSLNSSISRSIHQGDAGDVFARQAAPGQGATAPTVAADPNIAAMNKIADFGRFVPGETICRVKDKKGLVREMSAKAMTLGGDMLITFTETGHGDHRRRVLVTANADYWIQIGEAAVPVRTGNKYLSHINRVLKGGVN